MHLIGTKESTNRLKLHHVISIALACCLVLAGILVKIDRAPSIAEMILDPVRLLVPVVLFSFSGLRKNLGVSRQFSVMGFVCVGSTMLSEVFRVGLGGLFLIPAFAIFMWMLGHCWKNRGADSGWVGLALCLMLAPVF